MAENGGGPPEPVMEVPPPQQIRVLETADDIQVGFFCLYFFILSFFILLHIHYAILNAFFLSLVHFWQ